jgi:hypothetical protein
VTSISDVRWRLGVQRVGAGLEHGPNLAGPQGLLAALACGRLVRAAPSFAVGAMVAAIWTAASDAAGLNGFDLSNASVPVQAIQRGGPPKFVAADRARLEGEDRVLGLALGESARAYPVRILNWHEVVNDRFGDRAVVVTYCPLCGTGVAFDAPPEACAGGFGVSGLLYNSDVLLYDRATQSLWSQLLETANSG